uniref:PDZ and LIM domain protein 7-like n=1 Tax=Oncorhynchus gorbuscha TaxID=8017 RepID=UPI001EAF1D89|nr:PDZ and LIM domain protein 7-like [Oncorhynchus gorbuscha]
MSGGPHNDKEAMNIYCITLNGPAPWGFRLQGGKDFSMPLTVSRLTPGGKAAQAGVGVRDWVVSIGETNAEDMTHVEAQNKIRAAEESLTLTLSKAFHAGGDQKMDEKVHQAFHDLQIYQHEKHGLRVDGIPMFIPNDRSKKRLIEDTQDWQPRTGTTQSHSFHMLAQLTGTDYMQDPDDETMKRASVKASLSPAKTQTQTADKPDASKATVTAGPLVRPPWVTDPGFADRYAPDKTSTVLTQHRQPAQPTPMQNRSSILQAAQQAPEDSGRTPLCGACNKIIRGRYLVALGQSWHPEEFQCSQCKVMLDEGGFFEEKGSVFCSKCYDNRYAPNCAKCKKTIVGDIMHALKMTYHVQCFMCAACKSPIRNQAFYMEEGEPYCERDYEKMFGTKCHGCDFKIDAGDRFLEALGYSWHDTCFVCAFCQINLEGKTFYSKKDKPLCKGHAFTPV